MTFKEGIFIISVFVLIKIFKKFRPQGEEDPSGFTLIEALVTLTVFTIGIIGAFSFALTNRSTVRDNFDRYLATNLAREGLEIVRNARDSNWLRIDANEDCDTTAVGLQPCAWDQGLGYGFYIVDYNTNYPPFRLNGVDVFNVNYLGSPQRLFVNTADNDFYAHTITTATTDMYRTMQVDSICLDTATGLETVISGLCSGPATIQKIGIQVTAHLYWQRGANTGQLAMVDNLYHWRK